MPSYLTFDATNSLRLSLINRTLQAPNGPQTFTSSNYTVQNLSDYSNVDPGDVDDNRDQFLTQVSNSNIYKPEEFFIVEDLNVYPRRVNLQLYPYFVPESHTLIGIMTTQNFDSESELFKFASTYIRDDRNGPVYARIQQNLEAATIGRFRLEDALNGNLSTALNIVTGREPLIELNNKITVAKTLPGKAIDFVQTASGVEFPFTEIPGDYLSNPLNPVNNRPEARTEFGSIIQDVTGALGSLIGIQRRPKLDRKPSDLMIEYMGEGQKRNLFNLLSYSKYAPNYTTTARSQNSSRTFNFVDNFAQGVKEFLGVEAPKGIAYIGDDRGNDVKYAMSDFNDNQIRGSYYMSLMFDPIQAELFQKTKQISEGGKISSNLTWISKNSRNKLGENNTNYNEQRSNFEDSLSTKYGFRDDSILGSTQLLLDSMPTNGGEARSHVANVIDQTSRVFREGTSMISRGSAIKYVDRFSGEESGVEYCRVWTKDRPYFTMSDTMKRTENIRKFDDSVLGGGSRVWNINYGPMSNGNKGFEGSTNIFNSGDGFYAKKYMFSIENLAWKNSNREGFTVQDLPYCERGPNGGRVMWFPPYDLKVSELNSAKWEENNFLGRPEPVYTYQNTSRTGQISFKVVVDHPSVLNLLVRDFFKGMSDEEADNYINAFFAGCEDLDLYDLVRRFTTLDSDDISLIQRYLNEGVDSEVIKKYKTVVEDVKQPVPNSSPNGSNVVDNTTTNDLSFNVTLNFINDYPTKSSNNEFSTNDRYGPHYSKYLESDLYRTNSLTRLSQGLTELINKYNINPSRPPANVKNDLNIIFGNETNLSDVNGLVTKTQGELTKLFNKLDTNYNTYLQRVIRLREEIKTGNIQEAVFDISSATSTIADNIYNIKLSYRRSYSIILDILANLKENNADERQLFKWDGFDVTTNRIPQILISFKDLGLEVDGFVKFNVVNYGEDFVNSEIACNNKQFKTPLSSGSNLNVDAPISFACRQARVSLKVLNKQTQPTENKEQPKALPKVLPKTTLVEDGEITVKSKVKKPPIDVMKRLIMKTLSECFYFKKLEEDSPVAFSSLKEKLRYFHPGFHTTTPEGLNARLTFLNQCVRPGDTIPIKGISDDLDLNARNTTFGPPPICILRIGDFYHSKIIIRDVNISYEDSTWDLNPEGIGVQPMIANVTLSINFIGGQGLSKPVERLQNALSSNFYANTEMYDERSITTNKTIDGVDAEQYTKRFLEELQKNQELTPDPSVDAINKNEIRNGDFIGDFEGQTLVYNNIVSSVFEKSNNYFTSLQDSINDSYVKYGKYLTNLFFSNSYRPINQLDIYKSPNGASSTNITLVGLHQKGKELNILLRGLKAKLVDEIENNITSLTKDLFGFKITDNKVPNSDLLLKPNISQWIQEKIDNLIVFDTVRTIEQKRNELIKVIDEVNYMVFYTDHDATINGNEYVKLTLSGFTSIDFYKKYSDVIDYMEDNLPKVYSVIDNTINFNTPSQITQNQTKEIILYLLLDKKEDIIQLYNDRILFRENIEIKEIRKKLDDLLKVNEPLKFKFKKFPIFDNKKISYQISNETDITDDNEKDVLKKIYSTKVMVDNKLNYYKSGN